MAHEKIMSEQLKDPKCKKIIALLTKKDGLEAERAKDYFFWHEGLLMRRFVPLSVTRDVTQADTQTPDTDTNTQVEASGADVKVKRGRIHESNVGQEA